MLFCSKLKFKVNNYCKFIINMSDDWIMAIYLLQLCFRLDTLHLKVRMVSCMAIYALNPGIQIGAAPYFVI